MKINKMLIAVLAMVAVVLSSCKDDDPAVGIDSGMPAPAVYFDADNSTGKTIAVYWNPLQAISAGATSFTVQLVKTVDGEGDVYDNATSQTFAAVNTDGQYQDLARFENLTRGRIFYVRVRANYPRSVYSDWVLAAVSETNAKEARIMVGTGIVDDNVKETSALDAKVEAATITESTANVSWSTSEFADSKADAGFDYKIELFKDKECKNLEVSWNIAANSIDMAKYKTSFVFTGLTPETTYWFRATNTTDDVMSNVVEFTTAKSQFKELPATAAAGEVILFQDFHEFLWGGDLLNEAAGYSSNGRTSATEIEKATGVNPVSAEKFYLVGASTEMGLFNTLGPAIPATSLKDWGQMSEEKNGGSKPGIICARPGMMKMGANSFRAAIVTPELKCLTQPATIEVSFKTAAYDDSQQVSVELLDGTTKAAKNAWITATSQSVVTTVNAGAKGAGWTTHKVEIQNVTSTCRIAIGAAEKGEGSAQHRFYLDDIQIKVVSYGELTAPDAPAKPELTATDKTVTATWEKVNRADGYKVEYKKADAAEWTVAAEKVAETTCTIEGLAFETAYDVRVSALLGTLSSDPSEVASITTLAEIKQLATPQNVTAAADYGVATLTFDPVVGAADYEVYANGAAEKLVGMVTSAADAAKVTYKVTGLAFNTAYTFQVKAVADGVVASELSAATESATTSEIVQIKNNVGPNMACVAWGAEKGLNTEGTSSKFMIQIADKDGKVMTTFDITNCNFNSKAATINNAINPTRFTFAALEPATTYKIRLKEVGEDDKLYSPWCEVTTEPAHVKTAKEVLYQGFDDSWYGGDVLNGAGAKGITKDYAGKPVLTWEGYTSSKDINRLASATNCGSGTLGVGLFALETCSFFGYTGSGTEFRVGSMKFGGNSTPGILTTSALGEGVLNATTATPCTISFKVAPFSDATKSNADVQIYVVHADGSDDTLVVDGFNVLTNNDPYNYVWKEGSVKGVNLLSTDKLKITSKNTGDNACRFMFDDLLVVAE